MHRWFTSILVVGALLMPAHTAVAQPTIFFVRHAERADATAAKKDTDPDLSAAGRDRAQALAAVLKDANITAIFTTEYKRTQQTAAPVAKALGLTITIVKGSDEAQLVKQLGALSGNALVVGHSNTLPGIIKGLGAPPPEIADSDYDNLYIVTRGASPSVVRLHYH